MNIVRFLKDWTLIIAMLAGIFGYFIYIELPISPSIHAIVNDAVGIIQPMLIFSRERSSQKSSEATSTT